MLPRRTEKPRGRAVGDEDATIGPMDDDPPRPDERPDVEAIEKDRAKSSGRPPLSRERPAADTRSSREGEKVRGGDPG